MGKLPVALVFAPSSPLGHLAIHKLDRMLVEFGHRRVQVLVVAPLTSRDVRDITEASDINLAVLADPDRSIHGAFGVADHDEAVNLAVIDLDGKVVDERRLSDTGAVQSLGDRLLEVIDRLRTVEPATMEVPAVRGSDRDRHASAVGQSAPEVSAPPPPHAPDGGFGEGPADVPDPMPDTLLDGAEAQRRHLLPDDGSEDPMAGEAPSG